MDFIEKMKVFFLQVYTIVSEGYIAYFSNISEQQIQHVNSVPAGCNSLFKGTV